MLAHKIYQTYPLMYIEAWITHNSSWFSKLRMIVPTSASFFTYLSEWTSAQDQSHGRICRVREQQPLMGTPCLQIRTCKVYYPANLRSSRPISSLVRPPDLSLRNRLHGRFQEVCHLGRTHRSLSVWSPSPLGCGVWIWQNYFFFPIPILFHPHRRANTNCNHS